MRPELLAYLTSLARTLLAALDAHEDATEGREIADGVHADAYHPDHADAVYEAKSALRAASVHTPGEDPAPHGAGAPDASGGASGVGVLTNCDSCRWNRTEDDGDETCDNPDNGHIGDGIAWWSTENCGARFKCRPGATGCPGWEKREGA